MKRRATRIFGGAPYTFGHALSLNGTSQYAVMSSAFTAQTFTIGGWFYLNSNSIYRPMGGQASASAMLFNVPNNSFQYRTGATGANFSLVFPIQEWFSLHLSTSSDGSTDSARVFLNGIESASGIVTKITSPMDYSVIGVRPNPLGGYLNGLVDDIFLAASYGTPAIDSLAIYNGGSGADPLTIMANVQHLYRFNGNTINDGSVGGVATLVNSPTYTPHL